MDLRAQSEAASRHLAEAFPAWDSPVAFVETGSGIEIELLLDETLDEIPLAALPHMPQGTSAAGHELRLALGIAGERQVLVSVGRRHLYEGAGPGACVLPACAACLCGIDRVVMVCAAGAVNPEYRPGTVVAVTDYINNLGTSPLIGPRALGLDYFPAMDEAFSQELVSSFLNVGAEVGLCSRVGVYQANLGPQYETPSEVELARRNGADVVGMSLVLSTIAARALGAKVLGVAVVTNQAGGQAGRSTTHGEVQTVATQASPLVMRALHEWLAR